MELDLGKLREIIEKAIEEDITEIVIGKEVSILDKGYGGLVYVIISLKNKTVEFMTGVPDYIWKRGELEETIEKIFSNLNIYKFEINIHHHNGEFHDKDIKFQFKNDKELPKVITSILKMSYKSEDLDYCFK